MVNIISCIKIEQLKGARTGALLPEGRKNKSLDLGMINLTALSLLVDSIGFTVLDT